MVNIIRPNTSKISASVETTALSPSERWVAGTITNDGTILSGGTGVDLLAGGTVLNGEAGATAALISGASLGISASIASVTVINAGAIQSGGIGIYARNGATITNGSPTFGAATMSGSSIGVEVKAALGTVLNDGTIQATSGTGAGIIMTAGGSVTNGAASVTTASISGGRIGIQISGSTATSRSLINFGTITGGIGVDFGAGNEAGTVVNAGTISGTGGQAINFGSGADLLVVDPGAVFLGQVNGGVGVDTIELASGGNTDGTLAGLSTGFTGFESLTVDAGANWRLTGPNTIGGVVNHGTLAISGSASLDVTSSIGASSNGTFQLQSSSVLEVAAVLGGNDKIQFLGASELIVDKAASFGTGIGTGSYVGPLLQSFGVGDQIDMKDVLSAGTTLSYNQSSGILQLLSGGGTTLASLQFDTSTIGSGSMHLGADATGHALISRS